MYPFNALTRALPLIACLAGIDAVAADDHSVTLKFTGEFNGQPADCARDWPGIGQAKTPVVINDYRLFLSDIALIGNDGTRQPVTLDQDGLWQSGDVALLDFENGRDHCANGTEEQRDIITGTVPAGQYRGVAFTLGVPVARNHGDPTLEVSPLNLTSMFWNWRGGYKFLRVDLTAVNGSGDAGWFLHLGSTRCDSESKTRPPTACRDSNRVDVNFETFDPQNDVIVIDPVAVLQESDLSSNAPDTSPGCMSFPGDSDCAAPFRRLGLRYGNDAPDPGAQQLFHVRAATR